MLNGPVVVPKTALPEKSSISGWVGSFPSTPKLSVDSTMPAPNRWCQILLTATRASKGLSSAINCSGQFQSSAAFVDFRRVRLTQSCQDCSFRHLTEILMTAPDENMFVLRRAIGHSDDRYRRPECPSPESSTGS